MFYAPIFTIKSEKFIRNIDIGLFPEKVLLTIKAIYKDAILNNKQFSLTDFIKSNRVIQKKEQVFFKNLLELFTKMQKIQYRVYKRINQSILMHPSNIFNIGFIYKGNVRFTTFHMKWYLTPLGIEFRTFILKKGFISTVINRARSLIKFLNCMIENNYDIKATKDIGFKDIEYGLKKLDISLQQTNLSPYITFLQKNSLLEEKSIFGKLPSAPIDNITKQFFTAKKANKNYPALPEIVYKQIYSNLSKLKNNIKNAFLIMSVTGCRVDELEYINDKSLQWNSKKEYYELSFYVSKSAKNRAKKGRKMNRIVPISDEEVINAYFEQKQNTKELRAISGLNSIFVYLNTNRKIKILNGARYSGPINNLIKKYNIKDESGKIWHFTAHQMRASIATNLAEKGYAPEEIMAFMDWDCKETIAKAYVLIRNKRLMELNSKFFKEHFRAEIPDQNLDKLNLEERQSLFAELYVHYRQMEYGKCVRHPILGECGKLQEAKSCASCPKLITSHEYLPKWNLLKDSQQNVMSLMKSKFDEKGIEYEEYSNWAEYRREEYILNSYLSLIKKLEDL